MTTSTTSLTDWLKNYSTDASTLPIFGGETDGTYGFIGNNSRLLNNDFSKYRDLYNGVANGTISVSPNEFKNLITPNSDPKTIDTSEWSQLNPQVQQWAINNPSAFMQSVLAHRNSANNDLMSINAEGGFNSIKNISVDPTKNTLNWNSAGYIPINDDNGFGLGALLPIGLSLIAPGLGTAIGSALGASGTMAGVLGGGILGGATAALTGGDPLTGALTGGIGGGFSSYGATLPGGSSFVGPINPADMVGSTTWQQLANSAAGSAATSAVRGGNPLTAALSSGVSGGTAGLLGGQGVDPGLAKALGSAAGTTATGGTVNPLSFVGPGLGALGNYFNQPSYTPISSNTAPNMADFTNTGGSTMDLSSFFGPDSGTSYTDLSNSGGVDVSGFFGPTGSTPLLDSMNLSGADLSGIGVGGVGGGSLGNLIDFSNPNWYTDLSNAVGALDASNTPLDLGGTSSGALSSAASTLKSLWGSLGLGGGTLSTLGGVLGALNSYLNRNQSQNNANSALANSQGYKFVGPGMTKTPYTLPKAKPVSTVSPASVLGMSHLARGGQPMGALGAFAERHPPGMVMGQGGGQEDNVRAALSPGEYVFDADAVSALGDGNNDEGARRLDKMRENIRAHKRAAPANKIPPKAKQPQAYLKGAK